MYCDEHKKDWKCDKLMKEKQDQSVLNHHSWKKNPTSTLSKKLYNILRKMIGKKLWHLIRLCLKFMVSSLTFLVVNEIKTMSTWKNDYFSFNFPFWNFYCFLLHLSISWLKFDWMESYELDGKSSDWIIRHHIDSIIWKKHYEKSQKMRNDYQDIPEMCLYIHKF